MTSFQDRERAFEAKYAHDEEFRFLVAARRDKLFARWAADQMHLPEADRAALVTSVLAVSDSAGHDARLIQHVTHAFVEHGVTPPPLAAELERCGIEAKRQLLEHVP